MTARAHKHGLASDPFYQRLKALIIEKTGMAFYQERDDDLSRILLQRFATLGIKECALYLDLLTERAELDDLIAELTIGETYFFRYKEQFEALRDRILPDVIERNRAKRRIRIWSAGCATGPEPYTVAIILKQRFGALIEGWDVAVIGTDINRKFLDHAREGIYDDWAFRSTPEHVRNACFRRHGKRWKIAPEYQELVRFKYHNLVDDPFPSVAHELIDLDVILCRNVVIYFTTDTFRHILGRFHECLTDEGWLVVGHSELNTELFKAFRTVEWPGAVLYQKSNQAPERPHFDFKAFAASQAKQEVPSLPSSLSLPPSQPIEPPAVDAPVPGGELPPVANEDAPPPPLEELRRLADHGAWVEVMRLCRKLLESEPLEPLVHLYHALALEHGGNAAGAAEGMRRAIYLDRSMALAHYHLGRLLREQRDGDAALRSFRNALRLVESAAPEAVVPGSDDMSMTELAGLLRLQIEAVTR